MAESLDNSSRQARIWITMAGIIPDIDGLGLLAQLGTVLATGEAEWYFDYHHRLGHNIFFGLILAAIGAWRCRRIGVGVFMLLAFHLHLLCDLLGSRGSHPDDIWPVYYLYPLLPAQEFALPFQWELVSWQNTTTTFVALILIFYLAILRQRSIVETISPKADAIFIATLRQKITGGKG